MYNIYIYIYIYIYISLTSRFVTVSELLCGDALQTFASVVDFFA